MLHCHVFSHDYSISNNWFVLSSLFIVLLSISLSSQHFKRANSMGLAVLFCFDKVLVYGMPCFDLVDLMLSFSEFS